MPISQCFIVLTILMVSYGVAVHAQQPEYTTTLPGLVKAASYNPQNKSIAYAAEFETEGIFKSYDGGRTWEHLLRGPEPLELGSSAEIGQIFIPKLDTNILLVASKNKRYGIYRSTDGGYRWKQVLTSVSIGGESITQLSDHTLLFGQSGVGVLWRSTDLGLTWDSVSSVTSHPNLCTFVVSPADDNILLAGAEGGAISRSSDGGAHWSVQRTSDGIEFADVPYILFDPTKPSRVYATLFQDPNESFLISEDAGVTWKSLTAPPQEWGLEIDKRNGEHLWLGRFSAFDQFPGHFVESFDAGKTWLDRGLDTVVDIWMVKQSPSLNRLMLATSSGVILADYPGSVAAAEINSDALRYADGVLRIVAVSPSQLSVYTVGGTEVYNETIEAGSFTADLSRLSSGTYVAILTQRGIAPERLLFNIIR